MNLSFDSFTQCQNGNIESSNFSNWNLSYGPRGNPYVVLNDQVTGYNPSVHAITSAGYDNSVGGTLLESVGEGLHSLKIGNNISGDLKADRAWYTFTVTAANADFGFKYAMVLQDGDHPAVRNPFFTWMIMKGNNPNTIGFNNVIASNQVIANKNDPFFKKGASGILYRNWSSVCVDLTKYLGQQVTISFMVADCTESGHFGYAYIDALCSPNNPSSNFILNDQFCINDNIILDGTASTEEDNYFISIQESDEWWSVTGVEYSKWFVAQQAGIIDLKDFMQSLGTQFKCNKYYKVKLAVSNNCEPWAETSKLIKIVCPPIIDIPDITRCCNFGEQSINLGPVTSSSNTMNISWSIPSGNAYFSPTPGVNSNTATVNTSENTTIQYTVTSLIATGNKPNIIMPCSATETVKINIIDDFTVNITATPIDCCNNRLEANIRFADGCNKWEDYSQEQQNTFLNSMNISWNNGATGRSINVNGPSSTYSVTVSRPNCFTHSASYNYIQSPGYHPNSSYPVQLQASNALNLNSSGAAGKLIVIASTYDNVGLLWPPVGTNQGIYKADSIQMKIFNRWGEPFRTITWGDCGSLKQGDVSWNGTDANGNFVQDGVYIWKLYIKTCSDSYFRPFCETTGFNNLQPNECVKRCWGHIPGAPWWRWGYYCCATNNPGDCAYKVTVLK